MIFSDSTGRSGKRQLRRQYLQAPRFVWRGCVWWSKATRRLTRPRLVRRAARLTCGCPSCWPSWASASPRIRWRRCNWRRRRSRGYLRSAPPSRARSLPSSRPPRRGTCCPPRWRRRRFFPPRRPLLLPRTLPSPSPSRGAASTRHTGRAVPCASPRRAGWRLRSGHRFRARARHHCPSLYALVSDAPTCCRLWPEAAAAPPAQLPRIHVNAVRGDNFCSFASSLSRLTRCAAQRAPRGGGAA